MRQHMSPLEATFPPRLSEHRGQWAPIYLEPLSGSGERLCIGVIAEDQSTRCLLPVPDLERLSCVYGAAARSLAWAAELALSQIEHRAVTGDGIRSLTEWPHGIEGLTIGEPRIGAGTGLQDLASVALRQVSSLYVPEDALTRPDMPPDAATEDGNPQRLLSQIRRLVTERRPQLRDRFSRSYRTSQSARPLKFGYVGNVIAANFAALTATSANSVGPQVDRAKARLWDLQQLQSGVLADSLNLHPPSMAYELLVHRPSVDGAARQGRALKGAEEELEAEADKFDIRFRPMRSPQLIAKYIVDLEAA
jgi:hypothetical protein